MRNWARCGGPVLHPREGGETLYGLWAEDFDKPVQFRTGDPDDGVGTCGTASK